MCNLFFLSISLLIWYSTNKSLNTILKNPPTILIATPGRLYDHLTTPDFAVNVRAQFKGLRTLVYDEADRLLDQGFKRELDGILSALPNRRVSPRQVMLYSATISKEIQEVSLKSSLSFTNYIHKNLPSL